ncbi:MAG: hypothetical protein Q9165_003300 [Trypethelium subeluteriae]
MGGLLAAEVVLLPAFSPRTGQILRHQILGTINFDVPFLGMHPGVIKSGLGSIFNPAPPPTDKPTSLQSPSLSPQQLATGTPASTSTVSLDTLTSTISDPLASPEPMDQNFNPIFDNDSHRPVRGGWTGMFYFAMKHKDNLLKATRQLVTSHLEFGGAMADFSGLKARYSRIRALEEGEESRRRKAFNGERTPPRVRFVNYYTASTGRPKESKPQSGDGSLVEEEDKSMEIESTISGLDLAAIPTRSASLSPRISVEENRNEQIIPQQAQTVVGSIEGLEAADISAGDIAEHDNSHQEPPDMDKSTTAPGPDSPLCLPEIPQLPAEPAPLSLPPDQDEETRRSAEQSHAAAVKAYKEAVKSRDKIIKGREKIEAKHAKQLRKQEEAREKAMRKEGEKRLKQEKADAKAKEKTTEQQSNKPMNTLNEAQIDKESEAQEQQLAQNEGSTAKLACIPPAITPLSPSSSLDGAQNRPSSDHEPPLTPSNPQEDPSSSSSNKPPRDRKFCILPPKTKNAVGESQRDPTWVRVYMPGVDEVGAHCGLFFLGETYERLVGDVGGRIEEWCREAEGERWMRQHEGWDDWGG